MPMPRSGPRCTNFTVARDGCEAASGRIGHIWQVKAQEAWKICVQVVSFSIQK